jgi:hypothetical protein|tara:strand:+ start:626 stop:766 length:141 start_codon:yes stop_codon:yes gene_type:complete
MFGAVFGINLFPEFDFILKARRGGKVILTQSMNFIRETGAGITKKP